MTKEPIIVDCEYCTVRGNENKCKALQIETHTCLGITAKNKCPIYKLKQQFKRLENEYEGFAVKYTDMEIALKRKEQECEFWEKELDRTHLLMLEKQDELVKEILKNDQLEAEKKELKTCYNNNLKVLRHEEKVNNNLTDRVMKAEQALQEIKEIANKNEVCPYVISHHCDKYDCKRKEHCEIAQILQKCEVIEE